jgi:hypothetical protein
MRTAGRLGLVAAIALLAAFCTRAHLNDTPGSTTRTILVVDNQSPLEVTIHALRDGQRRRLGQATALGTTRLTIPESLMFGPTSLRFEVDPIGSPRTVMSQQLTVVPGDEVTLRIPSTIR